MVQEGFDRIDRATGHRDQGIKPDGSREAVVFSLPRGGDDILEDLGGEELRGADPFVTHDIAAHPGSPATDVNEGLIVVALYWNQQKPQVRWEYPWSKTLALGGRRVGGLR